MAKRSPGGRAPWQVKVEDQLREREGVCFISLLTDEAGAAWIARGEVPQYMREQALDALEWCATAERRIVELDPRHVTEREVEVALQAMEQYGGNFVRVLAQLYRCADPVNRARLEAAFADYLAEYAALVRRV